MNSLTICSMFLGLILISQSPFAANATLLDLGGGGVPLVSLLCDGSSNKVECSKVLSSPQTAQAKNWTELSKAVAEIAIKKAVEGEAFFKKLDTYCADAYSSLVVTFKFCWDFADGNPSIVSYDCVTAGDLLRGCDVNVNPDVTAFNRQTKFLYGLLYETITQLPNYLTGNQG
ncbi:putative pectinesterase inhibitor domain-containing protein [Medicago truncatula]|uniref:Putative pectinesterase inhibitor domain-containing protein n=1 Tax=Medicago truncatula TaxID=3880 RepID=A0A396IQ22_MEDTR|nr:uncharacterized protein LOC11445337 [Medicago truncatula]XP_024633472.1 uncharacterized protein LOC112419793 [Medicago truncatula]RHN67430.1 putative pectinesterase inhibitor domain-containing protein [Medicago truncatula]